jgi:hypothetical protein
MLGDIEMRVESGGCFYSVPKEVIRSGTNLAEAIDHSFLSEVYPFGEG